MNNAKDHMNNSWFNLSTATSVYNGFDIVSMVGLESEVDEITPDDDGNEYQEALKASLMLGHNGHTLQGGYDDVILKKVFNGNMQSNLDVGFTENPIGRQLSNRDYFAEYSYTFMNTDLGIGVISGGDYYLATSSYLTSPKEISSYVDGLELGAIVFEDTNNDGISLFITGATTLQNNVNVSVGLGNIDDRKAFTASANYVLNEYVGLSASAIGSAGHSIASTGIELAYDNFVVYGDYSVDLSTDDYDTKENRFGLGAKVVF